MKRRDFIKLGAGAFIALPFIKGEDTVKFNDDEKYTVTAGDKPVTVQMESQDLPLLPYESVDLRYNGNEWEIVK